MSGLLAQLDLKLGEVDIGALLDGVIGQLGSVGDSVGGLTSGPGVVGEIIGALQNPPQPEGLAGMGELTGHFEGAASLMPSDTQGSLAPLLAPFEALSASLSIGVSITGVTAVIDVIREVVQLTTGRVVTSANPAPAEASAGALGIDLIELRATIGDLDTRLDEFTEVLDPSGMLELLRRFGPGGRDALSQWPNLPIVGDMLEAFDVLETWEARSPAELSTLLAENFATTARFLALPRARVVQPVLDAANHAGMAADMLAGLQPRVGALLGGLATSVRSGAVADLRELTELAAATEQLESLARALDLEGSLLNRIEDLPAELELEFIRVLRVVHPALDKSRLEQQLRGLLQRIPGPKPTPLADLITKINELDISALTDPLSAVQDAIESAVETASGALETVRQALTDLLQPVAEGITLVVTSVGLDRLQAALADLPELIEGFVDDEIRTRLTSLKADVEGAVNQVSAAVDAFDPEAIKQTLEDKVREVAAVVQNEQVRSVLAGVQVVLEQILAAIEGFEPGLKGAADESVALLNSIAEAAAAIPSELIPDAAKPTLQQAVDTIADLDIAGLAREPLTTAVEVVLEQGALPVLEEFEQLADELRTRMEAFRPSSLISDDIEQPFLDIVTTLRGFEPSDLLGEIERALAGLREQIHVVDPDQLLQPLIAAHQSMRATLEQLDPERLLAPVNAAIHQAIDTALTASGIDDVFDGVADFLHQVDAWVDLLDDGRRVLVRMAERLEQPGEVEAALDALVAGALARVGQVDMTGLAAPLEQAKLAAESMSARRIAAELAPALRRAGEHTADALASAQAAQLRAAIREFPRAAIDPGADDPSSVALRALIDRLVRVADRFDASVDPWHGLGPRLVRMAGALEAELRPFALLGVIEGRDVLASFLAPPTSAAELAEQVEVALRDSLHLPVSALFEVFRSVGPHFASFARDLGRLLGELHGKFDAITGEDGLVGIADSLERGLDLLREFDLSPISDPLRTQIHQPVMAAVATIDPSGLRDVLQAVKDALDDLLDLANLFDAETITQLDETYAEAVDKLEALSPRTILIEAVDPVYVELVGEISPVLELPGRLRAALDPFADRLPDIVVTQLGRVELAFDALLRALPLQPTGGPSVSVSASVSTP